MEVSSGIAPAREDQFPLKQASELAARQFGAIARWQLVRLGFSQSRIENWMNTERLHRRYPGVYALGRPDLGTKGGLAAAVLYAGPGAALGSISALWWMRLLGIRPDLIHVDALGSRASRDGVRIRHPREVKREWHRGLPLVPLAQALLAATEHLRHNSLRLVLARAEFHHHLHLPSLTSATGRGRTGSRALRAAINAHLPQLAACESPLEIDFVLLCERFRVPLPEPNVRIGRWRPDMLWREARLVVELDGKDAHRTPAQLEADERRAADLRRQGWEVVRFSWEQVQFEAPAVAAYLRSRLG